MFNLEQILKFYPENLRRFKRFALREYVQCKILKSIFDRSSDLVFLGGTALRITYGLPRFSEDLDFDNLGINREEFEKLIGGVVKDLERQGMEVESRFVFKGAFRAYLKFPGLLFEEGLSDLEGEKLMIQVDTAPHGFDFQPELYTLDRFDVYEKILVTPADLILSQKIFAIFNRKKGRDFFDVSYLINNLGVKPRFDYLEKKLGIDDSQELKRKLINEIKNEDWDKMEKDVGRFLFDGGQVKRVGDFPEQIKEWSF